MKVNVTHPQYLANLDRWSRARAVIGGEDEIKLAGEKYLPKLDAQTPEEYKSYKTRACFFNATGRTLEGFLGLLFRRDPFIKLPASTKSPEYKNFLDDVDLLGSSLFTFCKSVAAAVLSVGRMGTLVDWHGAGIGRAYVCSYAAEDIINWNTKQVAGRNVLSLVVLRELVSRINPDDKFQVQEIERFRVLNLETVSPDVEQYVVEVWESLADNHQSKTSQEAGWNVVERKIPLRNGKPLNFIPFVFHGPKNSRPDVDVIPMEHIIHVNLDHYRLDADYKHGLHFTALPTAWVSGFDKTADLKIGSSTAWVAEQAGAVAGFLEFRGLGLSTFENAQNRDERLMAVLGSRMLEDTKKVGETADTIELRQAGENSVLQTLACSLSDSLTQVLRHVAWWSSTAEVQDDSVLITINTDFTAKGLTSVELTAIVSAWQAGAISQTTMFDLFRKGEVLPTGRTDVEEKGLIQNGQENPTGVFPNGPTGPGVGATPAKSNIQHSTPNAQGNGAS